MTTLLRRLAMYWYVVFFESRGRKMIIVLTSSYRNAKLVFRRIGSTCSFLMSRIVMILGGMDLRLDKYCTHCATHEQNFLTLLHGMLVWVNGVFRFQWCITCRSRPPINSNNVRIGEHIMLSINDTVQATTRTLNIRVLWSGWSKMH